MKILTALNYNQTLQGIIEPPADKSISHRLAILGVMAKGRTIIDNFLLANDCQATLNIIQQLGAKVEVKNKQVIITSEGYQDLTSSPEPLDAQNSGTTMRLIMGLLASIPGEHYLIGDQSLSKRPMSRVINPLEKMQAKITSIAGHAPITIIGKQLKPIEYTLDIPSAQVKSAIILAALTTAGTTIINEPVKSRNHTEMLLPYFAGEIDCKDEQIIIPGKQNLQGCHYTVPADFSSAAFWIVASLIVPNAKIKLTNLELNPTRTGLLEVIKQMNGTFELTKQANKLYTLTIGEQKLTGVTISGTIIPKLIDELPIIALLATQAKGRTIIKDAAELKVKETNRIDAVAAELNKLGASITPTADGMIIEGPTPLYGASVDSHHDHRLGMTLAIASLIAKGQTSLANSEAVAVSYPNFFTDLARIVEEI